MARWMVWTAVAAAAIIGKPALALATGECLPAAQVRSALAAENMNPIIVGNRTGYGYPMALIFFANADGSRGYLIRGDKPLGQQADTACVDSVYRDVRLNDVTRPGIPEWAKMADDPAAATAICKRDHLGYQEECSPHDTALSALERNGQHIVLIATGTAINPRDKSVREGQRLLLTVDPAKGGLLKATTPEGASYILSAYTSVSLTQNASALVVR